MGKFELVSKFQPCGDQPGAIKSLVKGLRNKDRAQTLYGVTGSGKTFTVASVVAEVQRPTLVIAHNKTLAAQLYSEFRELFPENAIEYFVSYYDYYRPEAYMAASDTYIDKDARINEQIDRMRHSATRSLLERRDVLIVASVSCIYGIGSVESYSAMSLHLKKEQVIKRRKLLHRLVDLRFTRNDMDFHRGTFRVRGDVVEIFPAHEEETAIRLEFWDDEIERIVSIDPFRGKVLSELEEISIYPNSHHVTSAKQLKKAIVAIQDELQIHLKQLKREGKLVEHQRLEERTMCDIEMLEQFGFCHGVENYSRHMTGRDPGEAPPCLLDYFPDDGLFIIDESHASLPQIRAMYRGDRSRKESLVNYGFRLPSALDNRPLTFEEFEEIAGQVIYVSATPAAYEVERSTQIVEQIIRPTGLLDPMMEIRPVKNQIDDLLEEIRVRVEKKERVLVTTLTKRMAEKLTEYYQELGIAVRYLHSDVHTLERVQLLHELRHGLYDVLVGINLLREGLDLPEVSLVAILDADQQGFLRSTRALLQISGRAARNLNGTVILYADRITDAIESCILITQKQREMQQAYNERNGITPQQIQKSLPQWNLKQDKDDEGSYSDGLLAADGTLQYKSLDSLEEELERLEADMLKAARKLEFEDAAKLRDKFVSLQQTKLILFPEMEPEHELFSRK